MVAVESPRRSPVPSPHFSPVFSPVESPPDTPYSCWNVCELGLTAHEVLAADVVLFRQGGKHTHGELFASREQVQWELGHHLYPDKQGISKAVHQAEGPVAAGVVPGEAELVLLAAQDDAGDAVVQVRNLDDDICLLYTSDAADE